MREFIDNLKKKKKKAAGFGRRLVSKSKILFSSPLVLRKGIMVKRQMVAAEREAQEQIPGIRMWK